MGILVQDDNENWYYFSAGTDYVRFQEVDKSYMTDIKTFTNAHYDVNGGYK